MRRFIKVVGLVAALLTLPATADSLEEIVSQFPEQETGVMYWEQSKFPQGFKDGFLLIDCGDNEGCDFRFVNESGWVYDYGEHNGRDERLVAIQEEPDRYMIAIFSMPDGAKKGKWRYVLTPKRTTLLYEGSQIYLVYRKTETRCQSEMIESEEVWSCGESSESKTEMAFPSVSENGVCYNGFGVEDC